MGRLVRASAGFLLLFFLAISAYGQDVRIDQCKTSSCTLTPTGGLPWSQGNQVFIFTPIDPRVSVYIFIHNNNPSNAHTSQTIQVFQTPFNSGIAANLSKNSSRWTQDVVTQNNVTPGAACTNVNANNDASIGASGLGTCYVNTMFAAQVAIQITGASSAAGSPDTFDLSIIQHVAAPGGQQPGATSTSLQPVLQPAVTKNLQSTSGANTAITISTAGVAGQKVYLFSLGVFASAAATCSVTVKDGVGGTVIWSSDSAFVSTSLRTATWPVPLASTNGNGMDVVVSACGGGVTSTLAVQESQL